MTTIRLLAASATLLMAAIAMANAQVPPSLQIDPNAPVYVVGYLDVVVASKAQAIKLLRQYRVSCAREDGNLRCEAAERMEQQNEFVILEVWKDQKSYQAHAAGPGKQLLDTLKPMLGSPYDQRVQIGFSVLPPQAPPSGRVVYVVTHVDIIPPRINESTPLLTQMAELGRKDGGNLRVEVLQQTDRSNHFSIVEIWTNKRQLEYHQAQPHTIQFRNAIAPLMGGLYDERLFKILD
jgi:quinol monooxygenase YgiN